MSRAYQDGHLAAYVEEVVEDFVVDVDPDELAYPDHASLCLLRADLKTVIEGRVADWLIERRKEEK